MKLLFGICHTASLMTNQHCFGKRRVSSGNQTLHGPMLAHVFHDGVIKWKHFQRYWPFVRVIHRSPVNSQRKGQWRGALMSSLICVWINSWINNREAGDLRCYRTHYDVTVMLSIYGVPRSQCVQTAYYIIVMNIPICNAFKSLSTGWYSYKGSWYL